jgi:hypothetical protein
MKATPVLVALAICTGDALARCDPIGEFRGAPSRAQSIVVERAGDDLEVRVHTSGIRMGDGNRTLGAIRGKLQISGQRCVGALLAPDEECSLFFQFDTQGVEVHQFGSCMFGAGAQADGSYKRTSRSRPRREVQGAPR